MLNSISIAESMLVLQKYGRKKTLTAKDIKELAQFPLGDIHVYCPMSLPNSEKYKKGRRQLLSRRVAVYLNS